MARMIHLKNWSLVPLSLLLAVSGCSDKPAEPPTPVAVEAAPTALKEAFKETDKKAAGTEAIKQMVDDATMALQSKNYSKAIMILEALSGRSDLTGEQRYFATRSMMAAHKALSEQAASGNMDAAKALEMRRATK